MNFPLTMSKWLVALLSGVLPVAAHAQCLDENAIADKTAR